MSTPELRAQIIEAFQNRYATKSFDPTKKISEEDWQTIIETARLSPSSFGYEPWKFLLVNNEEIKEGSEGVCRWCHQQHQWRQPFRHRAGSKKCDHRK